MKRKPAIIILFLILPWLVQGDNSYIYFGDARPYLPGLELMNSIYAENPAKIAGAVHNSISFAGILLMGESGDETHGPLGMYYTLAIPNFSLVNISQTSTVYDINQEATPLTKSMLGLQFGLSLQDFFSLDALNLALGLGVNKFQDIELESGGATTESLNLDFGVTSTFFGINLDLMVRNFLAFSEGETAFIGPDCNLSLLAGKKIIMDVDFVLGLGTSRGYELFAEGEEIDYIIELQFIRYFLSNSLRTGVGFELFLDPESTSNQIPIVRYHIAVNYTPFNRMPARFSSQDFKERDDFISKSLFLLMRLLQNLTLNFGTTVIVNGVPGHNSLVPAMSLGVTKFY